MLLLFRVHYIIIIISMPGSWGREAEALPPWEDLHADQGESYLGLQSFQLMRVCSSRWLGSRPLPPSRPWLCLFPFAGWLTGSQRRVGKFCDAVGWECKEEEPRQAKKLRKSPEEWRRACPEAFLWGTSWSNCCESGNLGKEIEV